MKNLCKLLKQERMPLMIVIIGRMGSGKTTLAKLIATCCFKEYDRIELNDVCLEAVKQSINSDKILLLFDDFSYKVTGRRKEDQLKLNELFRARHILNTDNIVMIFVVHYLRSLAVFIRSAQVRILTSITPAEINMYVNDYIFRESDLWDFYAEYSRSKNYIIMVGCRRGDYIMDATIKKPKPSPGFTTINCETDSTLEKLCKKICEENRGEKK